MDEHVESYAGPLTVEQFKGRGPGLDRLVEWLPRHIPAGGESRVVHGDFRCDNMIFHRTESRVLAVLDWEISTLGHPLADFTYHAMMHRMPPDIVAGLGGVDLAAFGIPGETDYLSLYCARVGCPRMSDADYAFYIAFNFFRLVMLACKGREACGCGGP